MNMTQTNAQQIVEEQFLEMRWRCLSLAADLDRIHRAAGGSDVLGGDPRLAAFRQAVQALLQNEPERAARVQMIFSDQTAPPQRNPTR